MNDLFAGLISSKTRINLFVRFFFNPGTKAYLRELSKDLQVSTNAVRLKLLYVHQELQPQRCNPRGGAQSSVIQNKTFADLI